LTASRGRAPTSWNNSSHTYSTAKPSSCHRIRYTARSPTTWCCSFARTTSPRSFWLECRPTFALKAICGNCSNKASKSLWSRSLPGPFGWNVGQPLR
jgi:hypothetical protein